MNITYDAVDREGRKLSASLDAPSVRDALEELHRKGLFVTKVRERRETVVERVSVGPAAADGLPIGTLAVFTRQMAMLLRAGTGVVPAMQAIRRQMRRASHRVLIGQIISDVEGGLPLAEALRKRPRAFDPVYCAAVSAGEASGTLDRMYERLAAIVGKRRAIRNKVLGALTYPCVLILLCASILSIILFFVLPRFAAMFKQLSVETPMVTRILLGIGAYLRTNWPYVVGALILSVSAIVWVGVSSPGRRLLADAQLYVPLYGRLRAKLLLAQILRTMGMLLQSGVAVLETIELLRSTTQNRRFLVLFNQMIADVTGGGLVSNALQYAPHVDPLMQQAVRTGEESGELAGSLLYCADVLDESNGELLNTLTKLIEPLILITMGIIVGGVAISLFVPLFDLTSAIH